MTGRPRWPLEQTGAILSLHWSLQAIANGRDVANPGAGRAYPVRRPGLFGRGCLSLIGRQLGEVWEESGFAGKAQDNANGIDCRPRWC
jgi:hypothetical protein